MRAVAGQIGERLRHERRQQPALFRNRFNHPLEKSVPVCRRKRIGVCPIRLVLTRCILVVIRVRPPP